MHGIEEAMRSIAKRLELIEREMLTPTFIDFRLHLPRRYVFIQDKKCGNQVIECCPRAGPVLKERVVSKPGQSTTLDPARCPILYS